MVVVQKMSLGQTRVKLDSHRAAENTDGSLSVVIDNEDILALANKITEALVQCKEG